MKAVLMALGFQISKYMHGLCFEIMILISTNILIESTQ